MKKLLKIINERKIHYIFGYLVGYTLPLVMDGAPSLIYYFPIKIFAIAMAIMLGNASYYSDPKLSIFQMVKISTKYGLIGILILIIGFLAQQLFLLIGIDIAPLIGIPSV